ncbi:MAG TPA: CDGSH iron-sulfur domain-containing protein [Propionibacterium sp.]|jgi:CDGSH-type Zn-finger protein|nr:CDGSH iron-sulfur domain-containing protein [Propionibacterium sp.]
MTKPPVRITVCPEGPLLVRGDFEVIDGEGNRLDSRRTIALCRCGASAAKPFCDGSHELKGFERN